MKNPRGAGSVVKVGGKFYARWRSNGKDEYGDAFDRYEDADLQRAQGRPQAPTVPKDEIPTVQEWAYICQCGRYGAKKKATTKSTNETIRLRHLEGTPLGKKRIDRATHEDCQRYADSVRKEESYWVVETVDGKKKRVRKTKSAPASASWVRRVCAFVSKMFAEAVKAGYRRDNPMAGLDLPEVEERENRTLEPHEALRLMNPSTRTDVIMLLAMMTGMRRAELARLEWKHVEKDKIRVPGTKSQRARRPVPMTPEVAAALELLPRRSTFVFSTDTGKPMSLRNINRDIKARKEKLGIPAETRLQDLRGSYGSLLIEHNADLRTVMELMGHADPRTTMKMYARSRISHKKEMVDEVMETIRNAAKQVDKGEGFASQG